jgi:pilus assembly protein FimV
MIEPEFELQIEPAPLPAPIPTLIPVPAADAGLDFDFDLLPVASPAVIPAHAGALDFTLSNPAMPAVLDPAFDLDLGDANADALQKTAATPDFDLSGITLDLNRTAAELELEPVVVSADAAIEEELSMLIVEMDTKLDLAVAYQEIGDKEGARELIDEVINGGSKEQAAKARAMLAQLG